MLMGHLVDDDSESLSVWREWVEISALPGGAAAETSLSPYGESGLKSE